MLDTTYNSKTDCRAELAEQRIPDVLAGLRQRETRSFRSCANLAEVMYRELRAWFRSKPPFTKRLPEPTISATPEAAEAALTRLMDFRELSRREAFDSICVVLSYQRRPA